MKKILCVFLAITICLSLTLALSSCGKVSNDEYEAIEAAFEDSVGSGIIDKDNLEVFTADGESEDSDNKIFTDTESGKSFIINKGSNNVKDTGFTVTQAIYKDIDNDGIEEVYAMGTGQYEGEITVALYDYGVNPYSNGEKTMELVARTFFNDSLNICLLESEDGTVHVVSYQTEEDGTSTVVKDYGSISHNGLLLEVSDYNSIKEPTDNPDMTLFDDPAAYKFYFDGKEFTPEADFIHPADKHSMVGYFDAEYLEKLTGQTMKSHGEELDGKALMTVYGKKYVSFLVIPDYFDLSFKYGQDDEMLFMTSAYMAEQATAAVTAG